MPFVPVPLTVAVEIRYLLDEQHIENTLYFRGLGAPTISSLTGVINGVEAWWVDNMAPLLCDTLDLVEIVATDISSASGPQLALPPVSVSGGALGQPALPNNVTLAVSFRTASRGRSFRGRNYIPVLTEGQVVNNTVGDAAVDGFQAAYEALRIAAGDFTPEHEWVVVSRFSGVDSDKKPIPRTTGIATPVTSVVVVDPVIDSQRRRLPGRGR
jgi:hypothetical protein